MEALSGGYAVLVVLLTLLAVCWLLLPLALFGMKPIMRELRDEQRRTNILLEQLQQARK